MCSGIPSRRSRGPRRAAALPPSHDMNLNLQVHEGPVYICRKCTCYTTQAPCRSTAPIQVTRGQLSIRQAVMSDSDPCQCRKFLRCSTRLSTISINKLQLSIGRGARKETIVPYQAKGVIVTYGTTTILSGSHFGKVDTHDFSCRARHAHHAKREIHIALDFLAPWKIGTLGVSSGDNQQGILFDIFRLTYETRPNHLSLVPGSGQRLWRQHRSADDCVSTARSPSPRRTEEFLSHPRSRDVSP